jgi:4-amino-4-deoxy-L-arabinose transferase-like glycosyltransferase
LSSERSTHRSKAGFHPGNIAIRVAVLLGAATLMIIYVSAALRHARLVNTDRGSTDQSAYMGYARSLAESNYTFIGDRNRMPLYPALQSLVYDPQASPEKYFARAKQVNIALSIACLLVLSVLLLRHLPATAAAALIVMLAFTVFVFKAGYVQSELLFYTLNFSSFLLMNRLLHQPSWKWGLLTGVVIGLSHLTKASVIPGLALFLLIAALKLLAALSSARRQRGRSPREASGGPSLAIHLATWACVVAAFLVTVGPYILNSKRVYGHYFYNVNSTFYLWYDSWDEVKEGTRGHGDRYGWPDMEPEMIPSPAKYLREHSPAEMLGRLSGGLEVLLTQAVHSYGYFKYEALYVCCALALALVYRRKTLELLREYGFLWLFNGLYFGAYVLLYAWFSPICSGNRLPLAQFLPFMFGLSIVIYRFCARVAGLEWRGRKIYLHTLLISVVFLLLAYDVYDVATHRIVSMYGGS